MGYEVILDTFQIEYPFFYFLLEFLNLVLGVSISLLMIFLFIRIIILAFRYSITFGVIRKRQKVILESKMIFVAFLIQLLMIGVIKLLLGGKN